MSTHELCIECEKQKAILLTEIFPEKLPRECGDWTLSQLQHIKKTVANHKQSQTSIANSTAEQSAHNKPTIGNSLLNLKMGETGQANTVNPGAPIANSLFGKRVNEL